MKVKKILASLLLITLCTFSLASCTLFNTKPTYKHRVTLEEFEEKLDAVTLDFQSFFSKDFILESTIEEQNTSKVTYIQTDSEEKETHKDTVNLEIQYDKANKALSMIGTNKYTEKNTSNNSYNKSTETVKTDMKIEGSSSTTRVINNIDKSFYEYETLFTDIYDDYLNDYMGIPFNPLLDARYYIDGQTYTIVIESGLISSTSSHTHLTVNQITFKADKLIIKNYEEELQSKNDDEKTLINESSIKSTTVVKTADVELEKIIVTGYTLLD
ncbi:MAG: hypothetical protein E7176_05610 [Erysipelotrichaceae bacterium]|nr:hypothetical protein [Erysipelotrichaceae bacterium]